MLTWFVLGLIKLYQKGTWFLPRVCRFYPSCSHYTIQAIQTRGVWTGGWMGLFRILRCHPFHPGGLDPVIPVSPHN